MTDYMSQKMDDQNEGSQITQAIFHAAIRDLARISEYLGIEPEEGGAQPIIDAIDKILRDTAAFARVIVALPADWRKDSSLETWFPLSAEELKRKDCEISEAKGQIEYLDRQNNQLSTELEDLLKERNALYSALEPFAVINEEDLKGTMLERVIDDAQILYFHSSGKEITLGDLKQARAVFEGLNHD